MPATPWQAVGARIAFALISIASIPRQCQTQDLHSGLHPSAASPRSSAPAPAYQAFWVQTVPLEPFLQGVELPVTTLLYNMSIRYVGEDLKNPLLVERMLRVLRGISESFFSSYNVTLSLNLRQDLGAPVIWSNGTGIAPVPVPSPMEAREASMKQAKLEISQALKGPSLDYYISTVVELLVRGGSHSKIMQTIVSSPMGAYIDTLLRANGVHVDNVALNLSMPYSFLGISQSIRLPPVYVLGTVVQINSSRSVPVSIEIQNLVLLAFKDIISTPIAICGRIQSIYSDGRTARYGVFTYTSQAIDSYTKLGGETLLGAIYKRSSAAGIDLSCEVLNSFQVGTQEEELLGHLKFRQQIAALPVSPDEGLLGVTAAQAKAPASSSKNLQTILVASLLGGFGAAGLIIYAAYLLLRRRARKAQRDNSQRRDEEGKLCEAERETKSVSYSEGVEDRPSAMFATEILKAALLNSCLDTAWAIAPSELEVSEDANGNDWLLGAGNFGYVYRGKRGGIQDVAIKVIKPGCMQLRVFEKELQMLRYLNLDKNLVQFYGACLAGQNLMLVMELMTGGDLADALAGDTENRLGWYNKGSSILRDVSRGLHFLHSNKVAHRDLKSKNILLTGSGEAKIGDVGLAKLLNTQVVSTQIGAQGTFAYVAPEVLIGDRCSHKVDIYSFGVVLWEVVTKEMPVRGNLRAIKVPEEAPQQVVELMEWCMSSQPEDRPTAQEVFQMLQSIQEEPVQAPIAADANDLGCLPAHRVPSDLSSSAQL